MTDYMLIIRVLGLLFMAMGALIGVFTRWYPEDERTGRRVRGRTGADVQRALDRVGESYFWTDRKLAVVAAIMIILGLGMNVFVLISSQ